MTLDRAMETQEAHDAGTAVGVGSPRDAAAGSGGVTSTVRTPAKVRAKKSRRDVIAALRHPKVAVMLMLGFSSGLPFLLTGNTLGYWLRDEGTTLQAIGFLSWVGLAYSVKLDDGAFLRSAAPRHSRSRRHRSAVCWFRRT